ncbi:hypothetical protein V8E54_006900, partial [Elaphomyces granulatus]
MIINLSSALSPKILFNLSHRLPGIHTYPKLPPNPRNHYELNRCMLNKKDSLKNLKTPESLPQMKPKKQQKLSFSAMPKPPPVISAEPEEPAQAQGGREQEDESYEELMVDSLVSIATGLDGSLDEGSPERLTIREVYDSVSA